MRRRDVLVLIGGAGVFQPLALRAQEKAMPVIGFLGSASPEPYFVASFRQGLGENGYIESVNIAVEYRWAEGHYDRLPALAADLVERKVAVIVATGSAAPALAAKAATHKIPIVFGSGSDPVRTGLVDSLNRPGGNVTGISIIFTNLVPKCLELLYLLVQETAQLGALVNPSYAEADFQRQELQDAAAAISKPIEIVSAGTPADIDTAFAGLAGRGIGALLVANDPFFVSRREQLTALAARHHLPAAYSDRTYVDSGGLMSYGPSLFDAYREMGRYTARILNGAKPADLPVEQPTKFELVINLKTAKALGLTLPQSILARADEVVE